MRLFRFLATGLTTLLICSNQFAIAQQASRSCGCEVPQSRQTQYDKQLWLSSKDKELALRTHLPWGVPANPPTATNERLLIQKDYIINYDDDLVAPTWTAHRLTRTDLVKRGRLECFRNDQRLSDKVAAFCPDYDEPIFDRGHMVPNGDMTRTERAMINTYMFSNMTPQHCAFNRGVWQILEELVRHWAEAKETLYVVTGAVYDHDGDMARDSDTDVPRMRSKNKKERVAIPSHLYKILLHQRPDGTVDTLSIMIPNVEKKIPRDDTKQYIEDRITTIDAIEQATGINFFPDITKLDPTSESQVESARAASLWPVTRSWPGPLDSNCK